MNIRLIGVLLVVLLVGGLSATVHADPVTISGTAGLTSGTGAAMNFSGSGLSVFSATVDYSDTILVCTIGSFCNMTETVPSALNFGEGAGLAMLGSSGSFNGIDANAIGGFLSFSGGAVIPSTFSGAGDILFPVTFTGSIQGYSVTDCPGQCSLGAPLWSINISGTGDADFSGLDQGNGDVVFLNASYTFNGTASPASATPEPSSLFLLGTGMLGFAGAAFRRRRMA